MVSFTFFLTIAQTQTALMATRGNTLITGQQQQGLLPDGRNIVIVRTDWNDDIVTALEEGAIRFLKDKGISDIVVLRVPGAVEIPFAVKQYWESVKYRDLRAGAFIALGCVIRGDTPHFDYVCKAVTDGIVQLNLSLPVPVIFGILTVDNIQQARERVGGAHGHKGEEAAATALSMVSLLQSFKKS